MGNTQDIMNLVIDLIHKLEQKIQLIGVSIPSAVKPAKYLAQLSLLSNEYRRIIDSYFVSEAATREGLVHFMINMREISRALKQQGELYDACYNEILGIYLYESEHENSESIGNLEQARQISGKLALLHQKYKQPLLDKLEQEGCLKTISEKFVDDALDLLWELDNFLEEMEYLLSIPGVEDHRNSLRSSLKRMSAPWLQINFHLHYHLGDYDGRYSGLYNPGVIGWSLVILSELDPEDNE